MCVICSVNAARETCLQSAVWFQQLQLVGNELSWVRSVCTPAFLLSQWPVMQ